MFYREGIASTSEVISVFLAHVKSYESIKTVRNMYCQKMVKHTLKILWGLL